jgi:hypothetical protein
MRLVPSNRLTVPVGVPPVVDPTTAENVYAAPSPLVAVSVVVVPALLTVTAIAVLLLMAKFASPKYVADRE